MRRPSSGEKILRTPYAFDLGDFIRHDDPAAAAEHLDMPFAALLQQIDHVLEKLDVASLIATDPDALGVFLDGGRDDLLHRTVVAQVDHFAPEACNRRRITLIEAS